jgi:hypothetical protein
VEHFTQSNPTVAGQGHVPGLLRRVADSIENLGEAARVQDIAFHATDVDGSDAPSLTVYLEPEA